MSASNCTSCSTDDIMVVQDLVNTFGSCKDKGNFNYFLLFIYIGS